MSCMSMRRTRSARTSINPCDLHRPQRSLPGYQLGTRSLSFHLPLLQCLLIKQMGGHIQRFPRHRYVTKSIVQTRFSSTLLQEVTVSPKHIHRSTVRILSSSR